MKCSKNMNVASKMSFVDVENVSKYVVNDVLKW